MNKVILLLLFFIFQNNAFACGEDGGGFMPENDMYISVDAEAQNDMTEERFNEIIDKVADVYRPIIKKKWGILKITRKWKNGTVNANALRLGPVYLVNMYGGLARHKDITDDGFALVVCHELGHHLGGAPKNSFPMKWASNEGQSDYWGQMKCFRKVFGNDDNRTIVKNMDVNPYAAVMCEKAWTNEDDIALCKRSAMAGLSLAKLLSFGRATVSFAAPDPTVVRETYDRHPAAQCRLDTYFQAGLCDISENEDVSKKDPNVGTCNRRDGHELGIRPLCWFKPKA